jgi:formate dehydrogenase alpha subunit
MVKPITITLDDREVSGHSGMTILELARESGIDIPTLCHDPHLASVGACRICLVENEQTGALAASCVTPIAPGMVIHTHSPRVLAHRTNIVKLLLASHPDSCMVCDKGNRCQLRRLASTLGIGWVEFKRIPLSATIEEVNPFIERDLTKCILCGKCIRACQEIVVEGAIDYFQRGFANKPATLSDSPLEDSECTFCGTCVSLCPTGALMEKERLYRGTTRTTVQTTCPFCGCGCSIALEAKESQVVRASPSEKNGVKGAALCVRGSYGYDFIHSPDRLTTPLIKGTDGFSMATWEEALERVATEFRRIKDDHGPDSLAVLGSSKCTNEESYLLQRFARCVLGTNHIDNGSRLHSSATRAGLAPAIGFTGTTHHLHDLEQSDTIMVVGADPSASAPIVEYAIKRSVKTKGAKLILIDPRKTKLAPFAHLWLRPKIGTDVILLNSMAKVIADEGMFNDEFVTRRTDNFETLIKTLKRYSPEYAGAVANVSCHDISAAARLYAMAGRAAIVYGSGMTQQVNGTDGVKAISNLALMTGNIGPRGGGIYFLQRDCNGQGACDMGVLPDFYPGYHDVAEARTRNRFEEYWKVSLPVNPGLTALEMIEKAKEGKIKGLYVVGENPMLSFPHSNLVAEALTTLDFLVVQDMFLSETANLAKVVLPAAGFAEKEGTFTNFEGRVSRVRKATAPPGDSLPDWEIILRLADRMGSPLPFSSLQQVVEEVEELVPMYAGRMDSDRLYQAESDTWETKGTYWEQFLRGFARFSPVEYIPRSAGTTENYPLTLLTGNTLYHFATGTRSFRASRLKKFFPQAVLEIGLSDARKLGVQPFDKVKLVSPVSELATSVRITDGLPEGMVFLPTPLQGVPVYRLFNIVLDPEAKTPSLKACPVRIERMEMDE